MQTCTHCRQEKPLEAFHRSKRHKSGYGAWCKICESDRAKAKYARRREQQLAKAKEWKRANPEKYNSAIQNWRERNKERYALVIRDWGQRNPDKVNAKWMKRDASKKNRTPHWLTVDDLWLIEQFYDIANKRSQMTGVQYHVDHVIPLQGKTVSGLHVPWNLQVIPAKTNRQKSNCYKGN